MSYLGTTEISPVADRTSVEGMRNAHLQWIESMRQSDQPLQQARAQWAASAMSMTDEQLAERQTELRAEMQVAREALRVSDATSRGQLQSRYDELYAENSILSTEGNRRRNERMAPELAAQQARMDAELRDMWTTGQWRDQDVYNRWLRETFPAWYGVPARVWLSAAHCSAVGTEDGRCANNAIPGGRLGALGLAALPFATAYYAWKKKDNSIPWAAAGFAAGVVAPPVITYALFAGSFIALSAAGDSARY